MKQLTKLLNEVDGGFQIRHGVMVIRITNKTKMKELINNNIMKAYIGEFLYLICKQVYGLEFTDKTGYGFEILKSNSFIFGEIRDCSGIYRRATKSFLSCLNFFISNKEFYDSLYYRGII